MAARKLLGFRIPERASRDLDRELERLERRGYKVFRGVSIGRRTVDVLAVGPTGVFVVGGQPADARLGRRQIDRAVAVIVTGHTGLSVRPISYD